MTIKLPIPDTHCFDEDTTPPADVWSYSPDLVRQIIEADRAQRGDLLHAKRTALATLLDYVERSTHWREGGATRHDAMLALGELRAAIPASATAAVEADRAQPAQAERCGHCGRRTIDPPWPATPATQPDHTEAEVQQLMLCVADWDVERSQYEALVRRILGVPQP